MKNSFNNFFINAARGTQTGQRCECENVTGWETRPRIVRTLADTGVRCQVAGKMLGRDAPGPKKKIITVSPESPRNHSNHVDSNDGTKNVYHRTCLSYFERRRTRMFILLVKNKLVLCPQTSRSGTTNCGRFRDFDRVGATISRSRAVVRGCCAFALSGRPASSAPGFQPHFAASIRQLCGLARRV